MRKISAMTTAVTGSCMTRDTAQYMQESTQLCESKFKEGKPEPKKIWTVSSKWSRVSYMWAGSGTVEQRVRGA